MKTADQACNESQLASTIIPMEASVLAEKIRTKEITCTSAVRAYIDHIETVNPAINAVVEERFSEALEEAKRKDEQLQVEKNKGALYGVPISIKESLHVAGMKTTGGLLYRKQQVEYEDAEAVAKLRAEGAIILGKTNTPTLCFCQETDNKLYGRTNNPWDESRTAGGSSGGEGALLAAGGATAGIGSDIGGSIRFPSHFNGVLGFKPGKFQVSQEGHFPFVSHPFQERMIGIGPMGKSVRDMELLYSIIAKHEIEEKRINNFHLEFLETKHHRQLSKETDQLLKQVETFLQERFSTKRCVPPFFHESTLLWQEMMAVDGGKGIEAVAFHDQKPHTVVEFLKERSMKTSDLHYYLTWAIIGAKLFRPSRKRVKKIEQILKKGDLILEEYLDQTIFIMPVYHQAAPPHSIVYKEIFSIRKTFLKYMPYIAYANVWGLPALTIPVGEDSDGMPIAIQLVSKNGNEQALFQLGAILEKQFRGYRCAF
ncbi:amidase [Bacillus sp. REN10]|uniref:amidase n=1 Tax=Bacillus sp. REN10 TaxID=2782541 RepID=UPI001EEF4C5E|nr:amidase [Bacillus sp. REN10]